MGHTVTMLVTLGQQVREARLRKGLSIRQLSSQSGLAVRTIRLIEAGEQRPYDHTVYKLADHLGLDPAALLAALPNEATA